jgi:hypothetical protein
MLLAQCHYGIQMIGLLRDFSTLAQLSNQILPDIGRKMNPQMVPSTLP